MWTAEFEHDPTLGIMENCYNNLKAKSTFVVILIIHSSFHASTYGILTNLLPHMLSIRNTFRASPTQCRRRSTVA
ncbi:hypothetical protein EDB19DRAFT_1699409 [Suillus lakei]|nr:hypothetical protein EDB19DRAFT_1699409 [Suillus lakei]